MSLTLAHHAEIKKINSFQGINSFSDHEFVESVDCLYSILARYIRKTPLIYSDYYSNKFQCNLFLKLENLQHTGSFKFRGAMAKAFSVWPDDNLQGFITASSGNHGIGVASAAKIMETRSKIYVPQITPEVKINKIKAYGGEVIIHGADWDEANFAALEESGKSNMVYFHPFADETVMRGQATIAKEILGSLPTTDTIVCSVGGGGLIAGMARYGKSVKNDLSFFGVETLGTHSMSLSLLQGKIRPLGQISSIAESIAVRHVTPETFSHVKNLVEDVVAIDDERTLAAQIEFLQHEKLLIEPSTSCCMAALGHALGEEVKGKNVVVVVSGANYSFEQFVETLKSYSWKSNEALALELKVANQI